ncbi:hypothetical protein ABZ297_09000 [Nonomuraea sp. NPDC005983]|uniref:hypothetical protein n=1 Tax=Nonomuraea sp. NPDC005983 TaxID=3155595 RepID=UPI0033A0DFC4
MYGPDPLPIITDWPGLDGDVTVEYSVKMMRSIADELKSYTSGFHGPGSWDGYTTGSTKSLADHCQLTEAQIGTWNDAKAYCDTVGANSAGTKFLQVYTEWVEMYDRIVRAIEANADEYARKTADNEGGREA